jgi:uracil-DNA glycosylase
MARSAAAHTDPRRWGLLYRLLWRITRGGERHLMTHPTDPDIRQVQQWCKQVGRGIHKMHAFVRFRLVGTDPDSGREQFVAWFEPEHRIVRLAAPFFAKRFCGMDWSILTPFECAHWDGESLFFTPGVEREAAPDEDVYCLRPGGPSALPHLSHDQVDSPENRRQQEPARSAPHPPDRGPHQ